MAAETYTLTLSGSAVQVIADHLKRGIYAEVRGVIDEIAAQVLLQDHEAEQAELQEKVRQAGLSLVVGDKSAA